MKPITRRYTPAWLAASLALAAPATPAHDLQYSVDGAPAVVVRLFYIDNQPFSFEGYEVYRANEKMPYQVGRTDGQGRLAFLPDGAGTWRIKAVSEDGHGLDFNIATDAAMHVAEHDKPAYERYGRIAVGLGIILGLFGFLNLYLKRKKS